MTAKKKLLKLPKKACFWITLNPYKHDTLVCVGVTQKEALAKIRHQSKDYINFINEKGYLFDNVLNGSAHGYAIKNVKSGHTVLIIGTPRDDWDYWEMVLHETHHIVQFITELKMLEGEIEAQAYLHEYLFRAIRRKICGYDK